MKNWCITDDTVGMQTGRKELAVSNGTIGIIVEYTHYTGQFTAKGRKLAQRIEKLLNEADTHSSALEARQLDSGHLRAHRLPYPRALARAREVGFTGREAREIAQAISGRKR